MEAWGEPKHPNTFSLYSHSTVSQEVTKEHLGQKGPAVLKAYFKMFVMQQTFCRVLQSAEGKIWLGQRDQA